MKILEDILVSGHGTFSLKWFIDCIIRFLQGQKDIKFRYNKKQDSLKIKLYGNCPDGESKTAIMLLEAFEKVHYDIKHDVKMNVSCHDLCRVKKAKMYCYCKKETSSNLILIPDFSYINWREAGVGNYNEILEKMLELSKKPPKYDKLIWAGSLKHHASREKLYELSFQDERLEIWPTDRVNKYITLEEQVDYKYLLDIQGVSWTTRRKIQLFSGRPIFIVESPWIEYWTADFKPFVHYIPVKEDCSNLIEMLNWADNNYEEALKIAENAQQYALNNLKRENAISYLGQVILENANS